MISSKQRLHRLRFLKPLHRYIITTSILCAWLGCWFFYWYEPLQAQTLKLSFAQDAMHKQASLFRTYKQKRDALHVDIAALKSECKKDEETLFCASPVSKIMHCANQEGLSINTCSIDQNSIHQGDNSLNWTIEGNLKNMCAFLDKISDPTSFIDIERVHVTKNETNYRLMCDAKVHQMNDFQNHPLK